jgi:hypothetical protein
MKKDRGRKSRIRVPLRLRQRVPGSIFFSSIACLCYLYSMLEDGKMKKIFTTKVSRKEDLRLLGPGPIGIPIYNRQTACLLHP